MQKRKNISMQEIQDYVENRLSPNHKAEIDNFLAENPEDKEALLGYQKYISLGGTRKEWDEMMNDGGEIIPLVTSRIPIRLVAACFLFVFGGVWAWQLSMHNEKHISNLSEFVSLLNESKYVYDTIPTAIHTPPIPLGKNVGVANTEGKIPSKDDAISETHSSANTNIVSPPSTSTVPQTSPTKSQDDSTIVEIPITPPSPPEPQQPDPIESQPETPLPADTRK